VLTACIILCAAASVALDAQRKFDEREIKATFLFNFAQFVEWPAASLGDPRAPLVIGVLGADPFGTVLDAVVRGEEVKGHPLSVVRYRRVEDVANCHILFVSSSEAPRYARVTDALRSQPILTVGDTAAFGADGGIISFITEQSRVRLRINLGAAQAASLTISSQLLRAAEVVGRAENR
jgi:hypothetical protein